MTDADQLAALRAATQRMVRSVDALDDVEWAEPSLLPGWSRANVVAHLALNAEALAGALEGVRTRDPLPMYADQGARDADLALGYTTTDWSVDFASLLLDARAARAAPPTGLVAAATDLDRRWQFGDAEVDAPVVRGPVRSLAWWATGRTPGPDVTSETGDLPRTETW